MNNRSCERMLKNAREEKRPRVRFPVCPPGDCGRVNREMPAEETLFDLAELFKIFGDSTRIKILYVLFESEMCVCDIAQLLGMTQSAISHQLQVLKKRQAGQIPPGGKDRVLFFGRQPCPRHFGPGHGARHRVTPHCKGVFCHEKTYKLTDLDCANCAAKMENAIKKIDGVSDASVSFSPRSSLWRPTTAALTTSSSRLSRPAKRWSPTASLT